MARDNRTRRASERRPGPSPERESPREARAREALLSAQPRTSDRRRRRARPHPLPLIVGLLVIAAAVWAIASMAPRGGASPVAQVWSAVASATPEAGPTPAYAKFRGEQLLLPVPPEAITVIAFHQSSFSDTYRVTPLVPIRSTAAVKAQTDTERSSGEPRMVVDGPQADADGVWNGWALEVWRTNVNGRMDSCLDCGARPGTPVYAPLTGTVMRIRSYKLYHKYPDYEIQIKPDAWNDVDLIVLHVADPTVVEGDHVVAGVTRIASVRDLASTVSGLQLRSYTTEGGNHTHIQLNKIPKPDEVWQLGEDPPGFDRKGA